MAGSALGRLVASVILDHSEFVGGADKAKQAAAAMATDVDRGLRDLERNVKSALGGIAVAFAAGFGISALKESFDAYVKNTAALNDLALKAGTTITWMSSIGPVAKLASTSLDDVTTAAEKLAKGVANADGASKGTGRALEYLGINAKDSAGRIKDTGSLIDEIALKLDKYEDGAMKTAIAQDLFGKSGANLLPFLKELAEYGEREAKVTEQQARLAKEYEQDLIRLQVAKAGLFKIISQQLLPVADAFVKVLLEWQKQSGGARDQLQALANDGSIRDFAIAGVRGFSLVLNAGDAVIRIFKAAGEEIGYFLERTTNAVSSIASAMINFIKGEYRQAWADLNNSRDAEIVEQHAQAMQDIFDKPLAGDSFFNTFEAKLADIDAGLNSNTKKAKEHAGAYGDSAKAARELDAALKALLASELELLKVMDLLNTGMADYAISLREQIEQREFEISVIGRTKDEVAKLTEMRKLDLALQKEVEKITGGATDLSAAQSEAVARAVALNDAAKEHIALLMDEGNAARDAFKVMEASGKSQLKLWDDLGTAAGNFFGDLVMNGKSAFDRLKDSMKSFFQELISLLAKKWILNVVASGVGGSAGSAIAGVADAAGAGSSAGSFISTAGSAMGMMGGGVTAGGSFMTGWTAGTAGIGGTELAGIAGLGQTLGTAYAAVMEVLAAIPVWGWIAMAVIAIAAYFGGKGGAPKVGGFSGSSFDAQGNLTGSAGAPGTDNNRFFTPNQMDPQLKAVTDQFGKVYTDTLKTLGGTAKAFSFLLGVDNDPGGTAQSRVSAGVLDANGKYLYKNVDQSMDDKEVPAAIALEMSRGVLVALQNSDLPKYLDDVFAKLNASTATQEDINNALAQAGALKAIFDIASRDPLKDVAAGMEASSHGLTTALKNNEASIRGVMSAYDGTLKSTQNLQQATVGYYNAQLQLLAGIAQAKAAIDDMFGSTFRNIKMAGMDKQGKYDFLRKEAADLEEQALKSDDPETIRRLADRINADINAAFNLLSPEEQAAQSASFLTKGQATQKGIDDHLDAISKGVADATKETLDKIKDLIGAGAEDQKAAAKDQRVAADAQLTAARTPRKLEVSLPDGTQQVITFDGD